MKSLASISLPFGISLSFLIFQMAYPVRGTENKNDHIYCLSHSAFSCMINGPSSTVKPPSLYKSSSTLLKEKTESYDILDSQYQQLKKENSLKETEATELAQKALQLEKELRKTQEETQLALETQANEKKTLEHLLEKQMEDSLAYKMLYEAVEAEKQKCMEKVNHLEALYKAAVLKAENDLQNLTLQQEELKTGNLKINELNLLLIREKNRWEILNQQRERDQTTYDTLKVEYNGLEKKLQDKQDTLKKCEQEKEQLKATLGKVQDSEGKLTKDIREAEIRHKALKVAHDTLETKIKVTQMDIEKITQEKTQLQTSLKEVTERENRLIKKVSDVENRYNTLKATFEKSEKERQDTSKTVVRLISERDEAKKALKEYEGYDKYIIKMQFELNYSKRPHSETSPWFLKPEQLFGLVNFGGTHTKFAALQYTKVEPANKL